MERLHELDDGDPYEVEPAVYARTPWTPDSEAVLLREDWLDSRERPGFRRVFDPALAREVLEVWSAWRQGRVPSPDEAAEAVIHYAKNDAYQPVSDDG